MPTYVSRVAGQSCQVIFTLLRVSALIGGLAICETAAQPARDPDDPTKELVKCGTSSGQDLPLKSLNDGLPNLQVVGICNVTLGRDYYYGQVNVLQGGRLLFHETPASTNFYASSIIVENGGELSAAWIETSREIASDPIGAVGGKLTFHLYGPAPQDPQGPGTGAVCKTVENVQTGPCGIPRKLWEDNGTTVTLRNEQGQQFLPDVDDRFYQYGPLHMDDRCSGRDGKKDDSIWKNGQCPGGGKVGYFGNKVIAVSFGGSLNLFGHKGTEYTVNPLHPSWTRLAASVKAGDNYLTIERGLSPLVLNQGDWIVVTTTDYLPRHSELVQVDRVEAPLQSTQKVWLRSSFQWPHNGERYQLQSRLGQEQSRLKLDSKMVEDGIETRAVVALLTRSITIVSDGDTPGTPFPDSQPTPGRRCEKDDGQGPCYSYGGHLVVRQGFKQIQIQGVEFKQMGQGGRLGHYPIHFHKARQTPLIASIQDSSINESMTRWIVLHSTQGVLLSGNIGYKSIGHGFYLEDGTETDNTFLYNVGIFARAAIDDDNNPRRVQGILAANTSSFTRPFRSLHRRIGKTMITILSHRAESEKRHYALPSTIAETKTATS
jgi:hypothetical protein